MNVFDLSAKITLDTSGYDKGLNNAEGKMSSFGDKLKKGLNVVKSGAKGVLKGFGTAVAGATAAGTAAVGAAVAGVALLSKKVVASYSDYEQLAGGIETLFGASGKSIEEYAKSAGKSVDEVRAEYDKLMRAQSMIMSNASKAYATAGMSMNEYMETSIQSAAALINSLGGDQEKAAKIMDMSITDMADNVNKMGTSMEAVQNAYRGFSRGNFMMLDNLALGFAGTKDGMQQLLNKAHEISGFKYDISSYADIVQAIHVVQDEMGITGTTAKEAAGTITGSISATRSAIQNLITGLGDANADIGQLVNNVVESASNVVHNIVPIVKNVVSALPTLINAVVDEITNGDLLDTILNALFDIFDKILTVLPGVLEKIFTLVGGKLPGLVRMVIKIVTHLMEHLGEIVKPILDALPDMIKMILGALPDLIRSIAEALPDIIRSVAEVLPEIIDAILEALPAIIKAICDALPQIVIAIIEVLPEMIAKIAGAIFENFPAILEAIMEGLASILAKLGEWFGGLFAKLGEWLAGIGQKIGDFVSEAWEWGKNLVTGLWDGIKEKAAWFWKKISDWIGGVWDGIKDFFGIHSPSKEMAWMGEMLVEGFGQGIERYGDEAINAALDVAQGVHDAFSGNLDTSGVSYNTGSRLSGEYGFIVEALKEAIMQVKIEMNDEEMGRFVDNTVTRLVYN